MKSKKRKTKSSEPSRYVLFGCMKEDHECTGYVHYEEERGKLKVVLGTQEDAKIFVDDKEPGHGTPRDWALFLNADYGTNVHPVKIAKSSE